MEGFFNIKHTEIDESYEWNIIRIYIQAEGTRFERIPTPSIINFELHCILVRVGPRDTVGEQTWGDYITNVIDYDYDYIQLYDYDYDYRV